VAAAAGDRRRDAAVSYDDAEDELGEGHDHDHDLDPDVHDLDQACEP
jgi:hypothetical protein